MIRYSALLLAFEHRRKENESLLTDLEILEICVCSSAFISVHAAVDTKLRGSDGVNVRTCIER